MTRNQLQYHANQETKRANLAREAETHRANVAQEGFKQREVEETARSNRWNNAANIISSVTGGIGSILRGGSGYVSRIPTRTTTTTTNPKGEITYVITENER